MDHQLEFEAVRGRKNTPNTARRRPRLSTHSSVPVDVDVGGHEKGGLGPVNQGQSSVLPTSIQYVARDEFGLNDLATVLHMLFPWPCSCCAAARFEDEERHGRSKRVLSECMCVLCVYVCVFCLLP